MDHDHHEGGAHGGAAQPVDHAAMGHGSFFSSAQPTHLLFESWAITSTASYLFSCVAVAAFAVLWMWLRAQRVAQESKLQRGRSTPTQRALVSGIFATELALGYLLMLVTMTYNSGLFCSVILGAAVGHFLLLDQFKQSATPDLGNCH